MCRKIKIFVASFVVGLILGLTVFHFAAMATYRDVMAHPHSWRGVHLDRLNKWENLALHYGVELNK